MGKFFKTIENEEWLRFRYEAKKKTVQEIADLAGCSIAWVSHWLAKYGIATRSGPGKLRPNRSCDYCGASFWPRKEESCFCSKSCARLGGNPALKNTIHCKEWLHQKYVIEQLSMRQIAEIVGCTALPVRNSIVKFGIKSRGHKEAKKILFDRRGRKYASQQEMIDAYGGKCACCGESNVEFLTLDHINGGGAEHRKKFEGKNKPREIRQELKRLGWPKDKYRLLCINCNFATSNGRTCPHELKRQQEKTKEKSCP